MPNTNPESTDAMNEAGKGNMQLEQLAAGALKKMYWGEKALTEALPKMKESATHEKLREAIQMHLEQTQEHVSRLEQVFEMMGQTAEAQKCDAMAGLMKEGDMAIEQTEDGSTIRDVAIIMAAQKVEHFEMAAYGSLVQLAETMGLDEASRLLQTTLQEEMQTQQELTAIAKNNIDWAA